MDRIFLSGRCHVDFCRYHQCLLLAQSGPRPVASLFDVADKLSTKNGQFTFNVKPILFGG
jgi:hypothetical protein